MLDVQKDLLATDATNPEHSVMIIPAAIKFSLKGNLDSAVNSSLKKIEKRLMTNTNEHQNVFARLNAVVDAYLHSVFDSYGLKVPQASLEELAELAATEMLRKIASGSGTNYDETLSPTERLYAIRNMSAGNTKSVALKPQAFHCAGIAKPSIRSDFERIERLLILQRMLAHPFSEMQCCRILDFIESELFGNITPKGWQSCQVSLGTPIDVSLFLDLYAESKERGVHVLSEHFRQRLQQMLMSL
jgi:hypothetical protein